MGGLLGTLSSLSATKLGSIAIECNHYYLSLLSIFFFFLNYVTIWNSIP
jgi:hypothetical protein